jgi:hypothetical protein
MKYKKFGAAAMATLTTLYSLMPRYVRAEEAHSKDTIEIVLADARPALDEPGIMLAQLPQGTTRPSTSINGKSYDCEQLVDYFMKKKNQSRDTVVAAMRDDPRYKPCADALQPANLGQPPKKDDDGKILGMNKWVFWGGITAIVGGTVAYFATQKKDENKPPTDGGNPPGGGGTDPDSGDDDQDPVAGASAYHAGQQRTQSNSHAAPVNMPQVQLQGPGMSIDVKVKLLEIRF